MHNIGILFVKMGQYTDACTSFEWIMSEQVSAKRVIDRTHWQIYYKVKICGNEILKNVMGVKCDKVSTLF